MKIGIIGGGSIGLLMSHYLANRHEVTLYVRRTEQKELISQKGIDLYKNSNLYKEKRVEAKLWTEMSEHDYIFVCLKQTSMLVLDEMIELIDVNTPIIFLQNGMSHLDKIERWNRKSIVGVIEHGATKKDDRTVEHLGFGNIKLSPYHKEDYTLVTLLTKAVHTDSFPFYLLESWQTFVKEKLIANAVINPLTALFRVKNGELLDNEHLKHIAKQLCNEIAEILAMSQKDSWNYVRSVIKKTKDNYSSMLNDIVYERETEIEAINGYLFQLDESKMYNKMVYHSILAISEGRNIHDR